MVRVHPGQPTQQRAHPDARHSIRETPLLPHWREGRFLFLIENQDHGAENTCALRHPALVMLFRHPTVGVVGIRGQAPSAAIVASVMGNLRVVARHSELVDIERICAVRRDDNSRHELVSPETPRGIGTNRPARDPVFRLGPDNRVPGIKRDGHAIAGILVVQALVIAVDFDGPFLSRTWSRVRVDDASSLDASDLAPRAWS